MDIAQRIPMMLIQMIPFLMAIVFHEVGHAYVARRFGDTTAEKMGRLTLNPVPHIDPIGTLLFPMINMLTGMSLLFGWAKPVPINFNALRPYRKGLFFTALAGPATNVLLALIMALFLVIFATYASPEFYLYEPLKGMAQVGIQINFALALFNLIPLPPLDGSRLVSSVLSFDNAQKYEQLQNYSLFILLALLWTGALNFLAVPITYLSIGSIELWRLIFRV